MKEDFKKWLCELAGIVIQKIAGSDCIFDSTICYYPLLKNVILPLEILIKAMWAINREFKKTSKGWAILMSSYDFMVDFDGHYMKSFSFRDDNSEQQALTAALEYVLKEIK